MPSYTLTDLAKLAGVTPRTVRYYISQGLLASPSQAGPQTRYDDSQLDRLLLIKKLQSANMPLADIRTQLRSMPNEQVATMAAFGGMTPLAGSAVDYIRGVLGRPTLPSVAPGPPPTPAMPAPPVPEKVDPDRKSDSDRSQWERIALDPDIELHVRRPLTRSHNKRVERLIALARLLFEEE